MSKLQTLMESNEMRSILSENQELIEAATAELANFYNVMNQYIRENIIEFLDENLEETAKNIYVR